MKTDSKQNQRQKVKKKNQKQIYTHSCTYDIVGTLDRERITEDWIFCKCKEKSDWESGYDPRIPCSSMFLFCLKFLMGN